MSRFGPRRLALALLFGACFGSLYDGFHTHSGATSYPHPVFLLMAWWTPLVFGLGGLAIGVSHTLVGEALGRRVAPMSPAYAWLGMALFGAFYFASGFLPAGNVTKLAMLLVGWVVLWLGWDRTWQGAALSVLTVLLGCPVEIALAQVGAFTHRDPDLWAVPMWLPALYMQGSIAMGNIGRLIFKAEAQA